MTHPYSKPRAFATRIAALLVVLLLAPLSFAQDKPKPNVLFIAVDDLNMHVGAYGYANAKTPNIDRIAARGVRF
jgi:iduronate 2-sulfatase